MEDREAILHNRYDYDFLVCFKGRKQCKNLLGKMFGHVFLFRNVSAINSIRIEPTLYGTLIVPYAANVKQFAKSLAEEYNTYVYTVVHEDYEKLNFMLGCSCVSIVKNILGIRKWWIWTPKQLEKYINKA